MGIHENKKKTGEKVIVVAVGGTSDTRVFEGNCR